MRKGQITSKDTKRKIGLANSISLKGNKFKNSGQFKKGQISPNKGKTANEVTRKKQSISQILRFTENPTWNKGKKYTEKQKEKMGGINSWNWKGGITKKNKELAKLHLGYKKGAEHPQWKGGKSRDRQSLFSPEYREWRMEVFTRDNFRCKITDKNCVKRLEAHHILRWCDYPELRYDINNGITLCHFHHPRKRSEETNLSPYFKELVMNVN